jgi:hypothetical protein
MRKEYTKPTITHVDLVPEEAVLSSCKALAVGWVWDNDCMFAGRGDISPCRSCGS